MYVEYISNENGYSGSFYINDRYFNTFHFVLNGSRQENCPMHFIFIMLCFKTVVATPGLQASQNIAYSNSLYVDFKLALTLGFYMRAHHMKLYVMVLLRTLDKVERHESLLYI
jgi:hypothetical protein